MPTLLTIATTRQEQQEQKKQENLDFIPIVHVKDIYKSFDYKDNRTIAVVSLSLLIILVGNNNNTQLTLQEF